MKQQPPTDLTADVSNATQRNRLPDEFGPPEAHACRVIEAGLERAEPHGGEIDAGTARVIAACLHHGPGSALEKLASCGTLHPAAVLQELAASRYERPRARWVAALTTFAQAAHVTREQERGLRGGAHRPVRPHQAPPPPIPGGPLATPTTHNTKGGTTNGIHNRITRQR
jgi:hypothetical protein